VSTVAAEAVHRSPSATEYSMREIGRNATVGRCSRGPRARAAGISPNVSLKASTPPVHGKAGGLEDVGVVTRSPRLARPALRGNGHENHLDVANWRRSQGSAPPGCRESEQTQHRRHWRIEDRRLVHTRDHHRRRLVEHQQRLDVAVVPMRVRQTDGGERQTDGIASAAARRSQDLAAAGAQ
jgi:hypothetical protein